MSPKDKIQKPATPDQQDEGGSGSSGAQGSQVDFHDFLAGSERLRDDLLPPDEKKRLLAIHQDLHESRVKKQKETRDQRQALKEGKIPLQAYREGLHSGMSSQYKTHWVLANKAQFSGIDRQVNALPNEHIADTNQEKRDELTYQFQLRFTPQNAPRFHPKPQYR